MTTDYRALCKELTDELHGYASANPHHDSDELVIRARAALAVEVELPDDGEVAELVRRLRDFMTVPLLQERVRAADLLERLAPQPVPEGPSDDELVQLAFREKLGRLDSNGNIITRYYYPLDIGENVIAFARAVLDRWGNLAPQPEPEGPSMEELAQLIYERAMAPVAVHCRMELPPWTSRGNSIAQDDARDCARAVLARWGQS